MTYEASRRGRRLYILNRFPLAFGSPFGHIPVLPWAGIVSSFGTTVPVFHSLTHSSLLEPLHSFAPPPVKMLGTVLLNWAAAVVRPSRCTPGLYVARSSITWRGGWGAT